MWKTVSQRSSEFRVDEGPRSKVQGPRSKVDNQSFSPDYRLLTTFLADN